MIIISRLNKGGYKFENEDFSVKIFYSDGKIWISKKNIRKLFCIKKENFSKNINGIFLQGEHDLENDIKKKYNQSLQKEESFYNLDIIISLGYRTKSFEETKFIIQANRELKRIVNTKETSLQLFTKSIKNIFSLIKHEHQIIK